MAALQLEPLSDEWFQQISALIVAPQVASLTTTQRFASGMFFFPLVNCPSFLFFFLPTNEILAFFS